MIVAALAAGRRVGITAPSHAAIQNLLADVERCAHEQGRRSPASTRARATTARTAWSSEATTTTTSTDEHQLVAGTAWLFARERAPRAVRPALHRRGRPVRARERRRRRAVGRAASSCSAIRSSCRRSRRPTTPAAPARPSSSTSSTASSTIAAGPRRPAHRDLAHASRRLRVRLRAQLRLAPALARRVRQPARSTAPVGALTGVGLRALAVEHAGPKPGQPRGGRRDRRRLPRPARRRHRHRRRRQHPRPLVEPTTSSSSRRTTSPSAASATTSPPACASAPSTASRASRRRSSSTR